MTTLVSLLDCLPIPHPSVKVHVWDLNSNWNWVFQSSTSTQSPTDTLPPTNPHKIWKHPKGLVSQHGNKSCLFFWVYLEKSFRQLDFHSNCWIIHSSMMLPNHPPTHSSTMLKLQWGGIESQHVNKSYHFIWVLSKFRHFFWTIWFSLKLFNPPNPAKRRKQI